MDEIDETRKIAIRAAHKIDKLLDKLETEYNFECEGGPLRLCSEWGAIRLYIEATLCQLYLDEYKAGLCNGG